MEHFWLLAQRDAILLDRGVAEVAACWPGRVCLATEPEVRAMGYSPYRWLRMLDFAAFRLGHEHGLRK